jgi:accessory gene regulator protein AgrB
MRAGKQSARDLLKQRRPPLFANDYVQFSSVGRSVENVMLRITIWKHAAGDEEQVDPSLPLHDFDRRHARRQRLVALVLIGAAVAAMAIVAGMAVTGLVIYLVSILPFVFFAA